MGEQLQRPENFAGLRESILHRRDTLPKRLAQVADYFVHNPDDVAFGTTSSIAAMAEVQPSTLVRFAQALGYSGFTDLQTIFRDRLRKQVPDYRVRLAAIRSRTGDSRHAVVFRGIFEAARRSLENAEELRDPALLESAVTTLSRADTIYLIGRRRAFPVVSAVAYTLGKLGVRSLLVSSANGTEPEMIAAAGPGDAVIAVSFTPYSPETVSLAATADHNGVPIVAITDSPFSPLSSIASVLLEVAEADFEGFRSNSATMALAMAIAVSVGEARSSADGSGKLPPATDRLRPPSE